MKYNHIFIWDVLCYTNAFAYDRELLPSKPIKVFSEILGDFVSHIGVFLKVKFSRLFHWNISLYYIHRLQSKVMCYRWAEIVKQLSMLSINDIMWIKYRSSSNALYICFDVHVDLFYSLSSSIEKHFQIRFACKCKIYLNLFSICSPSSV